MTGGVGGFYLASSLGYSKQFTGSYQAGLLVFAVLAFVAVVGLTSIKSRWRTDVGGDARCGANLTKRWHPGTDTHCPYCALQCGMTLVRQDGQLQVTARDFPTNKAVFAARAGPPPAC